MSERGEIIKVQVPLAHSEGQDLALIYAKGHRKQTMPKITEYLRKKMNGRSKAFFYGHYSSIVGWAVNDEAPWQDW